MAAEKKNVLYMKSSVADYCIICQVYGDPNIILWADTVGYSGTHQQSDQRILEQETILFLILLLKNFLYEWKIFDFKKIFDSMLLD